LRILEATCGSGSGNPFISFNIEKLEGEKNYAVCLLEILFSDVHVPGLFIFPLKPSEDFPNS
jgi:hypothetical protein